MSLSQGSQNSCSSGGTGGGNSNPPMGSPFVNRKKTNVQEKSYATNHLRVFHVAPNPNNFGPVGSVQSGIFITCEGQFEQKQNEILYQRRNPVFLQFIAETGVVPKVFSLGPRGNPMMQGTWQKKGVCLMHQGITGLDDNTVATRESVKDFVLNYWVPKVLQVNPVEGSRVPTWDEATTYIRVATFDAILDDYWLSELVKLNYIEDNETYPQYRTTRDFYCFSKKNLYSFWTHGSLTHLFKTINRLTNEHMLPADHFPVDQQDGNPGVQGGVVPAGNNVAPIVQVPQGGAANNGAPINQVPQAVIQVIALPAVPAGNNVVLNDQVPVIPPQVQVQPGNNANVPPGNNVVLNNHVPVNPPQVQVQPGDNANALDDQVDIPDQVNLANRLNAAANQVANDPLVNDDIVDSGEESNEEADLRPRRRQRRRLNQD